MVAVIGVVVYLRRAKAGTVETACSSLRPDATKVLFIGNSHTFVNDLPKTFCEVADDRAVTVKSVTMPGWTLAQHWADGRAKRAIESERWDWVVLQEQSTLPLDAFATYEDSVRKFEGVIRAKGAHAILYELWPRRDFAQDPVALDAAYVRAARDVHADLARVGPAWISVLAKNPELQLHQADGYHPMPAGTYLGACVFYASLFHASPVGRPAVFVTAERAREFQEIAWEVSR